MLESLEGLLGEREMLLPRLEMEAPDLRRLGEGEREEAEERGEEEGGERDGERRWERPRLSRFDVDDSRGGEGGRTGGGGRPLRRQGVSRVALVRSREGEAVSSQNIRSAVIVSGGPIAKALVRLDIVSSWGIRPSLPGLPSRLALHAWWWRRRRMRMRTTLIRCSSIMASSRMQHRRLLARWRGWIADGEGLSGGRVEVGVCSSIDKVHTAIQLRLSGELGTGRRLKSRCWSRGGSVSFVVRQRCCCSTRITPSIVV